MLNEKALSGDEMRCVMEEVDQMLHHAHVSDELKGVSQSPEMSEKMNTRDMQEEVTGFVGTVKLLDAFGHNASSAAYREQRREFIIKVREVPRMGESDLVALTWCVLVEYGLDTVLVVLACKYRFF
jgi:hypothetical protein